MVFNGLFWKSNLNFFVHFFWKPSYRNKQFDVFNFFTTALYFTESLENDIREHSLVR
jgi:hypothetical protein